MEKISVLIIAHNEEDHIAECIESILHQSISPDEIVLIVHNSTDKTLGIAQKYREVRIIEHITKGKGPHFARIRGFEEVQYEIVACIDGDSIADKNWLQNITKPFIQNTRIVGVGGFVHLIQNPWIGRFFFLQGFPILRDLFHFYFWGMNFACRKSAYQKSGGIEPIEDIRHKIHLGDTTEDLYLSLALEKIGKVTYTPFAKVSTYPGRFFDPKGRGKRQREDRKKLMNYFGVKRIF